MEATDYRRMKLWSFANNMVKKVDATLEGNPN